MTPPTYPKWGQRQGLGNRVTRYGGVLWRVDYRHAHPGDLKIMLLERRDKTTREWELVREEEMPCPRQQPDWSSDKSIGRYWATIRWQLDRFADRLPEILMESLL